MAQFAAIYSLSFFKTRTVNVAQFCGQHLCSLLFHRREVQWKTFYEENDVAAKLMFAVLFHFPEDGRKALMTLSIIPNTLQVIWQRCRDVVAHACVIMVIRTHVIGGDGYPRWYEFVGKFFQQQFLLHYSMA